MSKNEKLLIKDLVTLSRRGSGGFKTVADRSKIFERLAKWLAGLNIQICSAEQLKVKHIELYIHSRKEENLSERTLQNEMSAIRHVCGAVGKTEMADPNHSRLSNKALGIAGASRAGTKVALSNERYQELLIRVQNKDEGVAAVMQLSRYLGLRNEEAVQAAKSVKTWKQAILRGEDTVRVIFGTKGGRARDTRVIEREKVVSAINNAIAYAEKHNGKLIDKPSLKQAMTRYINVTRRDGGLVGKESNHSLRYAYAQDVEAYYKLRGFSDQEAHALTSMDLGHGDE